MLKRAPPELNIWPAQHVGQVHTVQSAHGYWRGNIHEEEVQSTDPVALDLTVLSKGPEGPRVFLIKDLLSDFECEHIKDLGTQVIAPSIVGSHGGFKSSTRTSQTGWLNKDKTKILTTMHKRFADVLGMDYSTLKKASEELQVVKYDQGQEYKPHHDFSDTGVANQRFLTLLLYVDPPEEGGFTSFPKAANTKGIRVRPSKGSGVLFYSMMPDGNGDDLSLHAAEPVTKGVKWVCNLWIWDPHRDLAHEDL